MEFALVAIALGVVFFVVQFGKNKQREVERRDSLRFVEIDESDDMYRDVYVFDLEEMTAVRTWDVLDTPGMLRERRYQLRERAGRWQWKLTRASWEKELADAQRDASNPRAFLRDEATARAASLAAGARWESIGEAASARLKTAHLRYIRQG